jgi:hypothetical protein
MSWSRPGWWTAAVVVAAMALVVSLAVVAVGLADLPRETGYLGPVFAPDGQSIFVIRRNVSGLVLGFGREFFTPPASVRIRSDHFALLNVRLADGRVSVAETFPASPLEGAQFGAYHGAILGEAHGHLRWGDPSHLDYELGVTRPDSPASRTFITRRVWDGKKQSFTTIGPWLAGSTGLSGDEPQQLAGDLEVIAPPGGEGMGCAIVVYRKGDAAGRALVETRACRQKYPSGYTADALKPMSRRDAIERSALIRSTYAGLVDRNRKAGVPEGQAMLDANDEMSRLGLYPKPTTMVATRTECSAASPRFDIVDDQFKVGLFPDIEAAIASPGRPVHKSIGTYITHRDYTTSQQINEYLSAGHDSFFVRARGGACWQLTIQRDRGIKD